MEEGKKEEHKHHEHSANPHQKNSRKPDLWTLFLAAVLVLGLLLVFINFQIFNLNKGLKDKADKALEASKPARIELTSIKDSKCPDCYGIDGIISSIKSQKVNITKEVYLDFSSREAKELISRYNIGKIPALILTGEIDKAGIEGLAKKDNALILPDMLPPYTNASNGKVEGRVTMYILKDPDCVKCNDLDALTAQIRYAGIRISSERNFTKDSLQGQELIKKYKIGFLPSLVLSQDARVYSIVQSAWPQIGTKENDGAYVLRTVYPPYLNLTTGETKGVVKITYLKDKSCIGCYNVSLHEQILASPQTFGIRLDEREEYDISDSRGKELIAKYNITLVPTVVLSKEVSAYPTSSSLKEFFAEADDGSLIFRAPQVLGSYKDLATGEIVKPQQQAAETEPA